MDVRAEATLHLNCFQDEYKVRQIVRSYGVRLSELGGGRVRVNGNYLQLKEVHAHLKGLLEARAELSREEASSSNAAFGPSKSRSLQRSKSLPYHRTQSSPVKPVHTSSHSLELKNSTLASFRSSGEESFVIDADVFKYADRFRKNQIDDIMHNSRVSIYLEEESDRCVLTVQGHRPSMAVTDLRKFYNDLHNTLRTQEVPKKEMSTKGKALWKQIRKSGSVCDSVLVLDRKDVLHLVGPSGKSYELKERLLKDQPRLDKQKTFRWKFPFTSKGSQHRDQKGSRHDDDQPAGGAAGGGSPDTEPKMSGGQSLGGFSKKPSLRKKHKPDRTSVIQQEGGPLPSPSHSPPSGLSKFFSLFKRTRSNKKAPR